MPIQAIIFDFDGLILDTESALYEGWQATYGAYGAELPLDRWQAIIGTAGGFDPYEHLATLTGRRIERALLDAEWGPRWQARLDALQPLPGVHSVIEAATELGLERAVASSSDRAWVEGWLARHELRHHFACVITSDDVERVKPDPALFLRAAECLGVAPAACLVFEDSAHGMRAARAAGMHCVAVPGPMTRDMALPEVALRLGSLAEMPLHDILAKLTR